MSAGSPDSATQRNGPRPSQNCGRMKAGHEARVVERVGDARLLRLGPQVVAVVEDDRARALEREHRPDVGGHRATRSALVFVWQRRAQLEGVGEGDLVRDVAAQRVVGRRLVGDEVEPFACRRPGGLDLGGVADERDAQRLPGGRCLARPAQRLGRVAGQPVDVADVEPAARPRLVDLDGDADALVHGHGQRLGAAHPAQTRGQRHGPAQRAAEMLARRLRERLVGALQDPLRPDVDPRAGGHLAVHHQAGLLELAEDLPGRPLADEIRVGDEHPRRPRVRADDADRLARLDQQRLVVAELAQLADDRVEGAPRPSRASGPAVDDEVVGVLGDLRVEVVHEHPERRFLRPAATGQLGAARGANGTGADCGVRLGHGCVSVRAPSSGGQPRARRMTGNRSSAMASSKPTDSQNRGVAALVASGRAPISG